MSEALITLEGLVVVMEQRLALPIEELRLLPAIVCVIDEYINFIKSLDGGMKSKLMAALSSLLRLGRQAKIHVILATQEPGKADMQINLNNINGRIAFNCSNVYNSVSILREKGAEKLPGKGALYFKSPEHQDPVPLQGSFMPTEEIERVVAHIASKPHDISNKVELPEIVQLPMPVTNILTNTFALDNRKELADIIMWALSRETISGLQIIQSFRMGNRAYDIVEELCQMGIVESKYHKQQRKVIPVCIEDLSSDVIDFLAHYGYTQEDIEKAIDDRLVNSDSEDCDLTIDPNQPKCESPKKAPTITALCELENLIGLDVVKTKVKEIATFIERRGKKNANICYHMCFRGNPGVGKTTVARIIARIFYEAGVIKKNLLVETDRGGLCGQYVGETAIKTEKKIHSAMGGVLFIDEAYSLFSDSEKDFGNEAVATLVKQMEDKRDKFICIFAGYTNEMNSMFEMNPGLSDRVQFYIDFPDYSVNELLQIFEKLCKGNNYELSKSAKDTLIGKFSCVIATKSRNFSNGRFVRKIFERVQMKQANRTCDDTITDEDIKAVFAEPDILALLGDTNSCEVG